MSLAERNVLVVDPYNEIVGPHQVVARFVEKLSKKGWRFYVVVPSRGPTYDHFRTMGIELFLHPGVEYLRRHMPLKQYLRMALLSISSVVMLIRIIRLKRISLVHSGNANCWVGGIAARLARVPNIYHVHDLTLKSSRLSNFLIGQAIHRTCDLTICVSQAAVNSLPMASVNRAKSIVLYNAVDPTVFYPDPEIRSQVRKELELPQSAPLVAAIGTLDMRKGQDIFIKAARLIKDAVCESEFLIAGPRSAGDRDGSYVGLLDDLVCSLKMTENIRFLGARHDIPRLMQAVDVVIQASLTEAGPIVPLEAMSSGVPVVATNVGATPEEVVDRVTGILVPPGDYAAMAAAAIALLKDVTLRAKLGNAGREWVKHNFDLDTQAAKLDSIYTALLSRV
jgi:glycosyltransferase involved in cell wall biosynthesis